MEQARDTKIFVFDVHTMVPGKLYTIPLHHIHLLKRQAPMRDPTRTRGVSGLQKRGVDTPRARQTKGGERRENNCLLR